MTFYFTQSVPSWSKTDFARLGYHFETINTSFEKALSQNINLILWENELETLIKKIDLIKDSKNNIVIIIGHHHLCHHLLDILDKNINKQTKIKLIGLKFMKNVYQNLKIYQLSSSELFCHHDFIFYLTKKWRQNKSNISSNKFLLLSANKRNDYRTQIYNNIINAHSDKFLKTKQQSTEDLYKKRDELTSWVKKTFQGSNMLGGFGSGTPRFDLYEQIFAEVVLETVYQEPIAYLSEKTWRPIACGVPALFLLNPSSINYLESLGYILAPKNLYNELKENNNWRNLHSIVHPYLLDHTAYKEELIESAEKNYNIFWQMKSYWELGVECCKSAFETSPIGELEKKLQEI